MKDLGAPSVVLMPVNAISLSLSVIIDAMNKDASTDITFFDNNSNIHGKIFRKHDISAANLDFIKNATVVICSYRAHKALMHQLTQLANMLSDEEKPTIIMYNEVITPQDTDKMLQALSSIDEVELRRISTAHFESVFMQGDLSIKTGLSAGSSDAAIVGVLSLIITERCTLRCKDCAAWMPLYERPCTFEAQEVIDGFDRLRRVADFIQYIGIQGGETLLHRDLPQIVAAVCESDNVGYVNVITNGTLQPTDDLLSTMRQFNNVAFRVSDYGVLSKEIDKIEALCKSRQVRCVTLREMTWYYGPVLEPKNTDYNSVQKKYAACQMNCAGLAKNYYSKCQNALLAHLLQAIPPDTKGDPSVLDLSSPEFSKEVFVSHINSTTPMQACWVCSGKTRYGKEITPAEQSIGPIFYEKYE